MEGGPNVAGSVKDDAVSVVAEDIVVCGVCGTGSNSHIIAKCARCNDYEHGYCMKVLTFVIPREWHCAKCQEYANGGPKPSHGGQKKLEMNKRETSKLHLSNSNVVPQISPKSHYRFGNAKEKFVSSEEAVLSSRERPPFVRSRFAVPQPSKASFPPTKKNLSNLNYVSPSRSDKQVQALKRCADASQSQTKIEDRSYFAMQQRQVHPASPPSMKLQPSNMKSICPGRIDMQVQNLKRPLCASNDDTGCKSEMGSLNQYKSVMLTMGPIVEYSRRPAPAICWRGCFHVFYAGAKHIGEFKAQFPLKVSSRVCDAVKMIPSDLQLELLPRMEDWPKSFETIRPVHEDIGMFFFSDKPDGCEKEHSNLLEDSINYCLRAYIDGIKLLIYSSEVLPPDSQWIDGKNFLWGLFVRSKGKSDPWQFGPTTR